MADKKTTKKVSKKLDVNKPFEQLMDDIAAKQKDLTEAKRSNAARELTSPHIITTLRRDIARLFTAAKSAQKATKENK